MTNNLLETKTLREQVLPILAFAGLLLAFIGYVKWREYQLVKDSYIRNGALITSYTESPKYRGEYDLEFTFTIGPDTYTGSTRLYHLTDAPYSFIGRHVPVAYVPNNPGNNKLMMTPKDFEERYYTYPDSLHWVLPFLGK
ncbi:hypothetical protein [Dinghuibacter silviterrae]|uniref:DUF3592 domain-containing protein n=1 Tax=Dinghuibacter silviterrae TaxID=1539049 RepID=A0A4R8DVF9_9BACT|nr:hypothetical protein [Dinghuibacter silviterrae]TDX02412.1 hypothetical protein EDB95_3470 [Dinghuibacter silviterrae]